MRRVIWSPDALAALEAYIDWIAERDDRTAERIQREIEEWADGLADHPFIGNPNRWPGFYTHGYPKRSKRIIYEVFDDRIEIAGFRDTRQDNTALNLTPVRNRT